MKESSLKYLASLLKELGLAGFIVLVITFTFLVFATVDQKREFIDRFILLKDFDNNKVPFFVIVIVLLSIVIIQNILFRARIRILNADNTRIGLQKSELERLLTEKQLNSSQK